MEKSRQDRTTAQGTQAPQSQTPQEQGEALREGARRLTDRDTPPDAPKRGASTAEADRNATYRPDANVDNEKHSGKKPGVDMGRDTTPVPGAQVVRDKTSHKQNINEKADQVRTNQRNG